jgi:hypothetical protein
MSQIATWIREVHNKLRFEFQIFKNPLVNVQSKSSSAQLHKRRTLN